MFADLRFACRALVKKPGFALTTVLIVALGIGAATAMFSTINALVLRPIALPEPDRLVAVYETNLARNQPFFSVSIPNYADWTAQARSWESLAAINWHAMNLTGDGDPELVQVKQITANFLPTLGIATTQGRNFLPTEDRPGGAPVAIITTPFWQRHLGGAPNVIGRTLTLDGTPYEIVGVTAPGQPLPEDLEVAIPLAANPAQERRMNHELNVFGRLKPGVTLAQADAELKSIAQQISATLPAAEQGWSTRLVPFAREIVGDSVRQGLYLLLGAVGLLLLIACANLSNLLLVRASARAHELAIRTALGASRSRVVRQIVTESLLVTGIGGVLGVFLAWWTIDLLRAAPLPRAPEISLDPRVLAVAVAATLLVGLLSGLGPALAAAGARPQEALKHRAPRSGHRSRLRDGMVVAQLALSLTLLVGATLLGRSFLRLLQVDPGFTSAQVLTVSMRPGDSDRAAAFYEQLTARVTALPGVTGAGVISALPLTEGNTSLNVFPAGPSLVPPGESIQANWRLVDGGYFSALQIPVLRGKTFAGVSPREAVRSVVISARLARLLWGDEDPVGRQLDPGGGGNLITVIGVVGDVRAQALGHEANPAFYWSMHRFIYGPMNLVVRSAGDPTPLLAAIRATVHDLDPTVPLFRVRTLDAVRRTSLEQQQLLLSLLAAFTAVALLLAALGTYGVIAFAVQQRTHEFGIRVAIGAQAADILQLVLGQGARLIVLGAGLGLAGALAVTRLLGAMLYHTEASDPLSFTVSTLLLAAVALGAAFIPARRATRVDPLVALRSE